MSAISATYVFGGGENEQQRLIEQAEGLEAEARWLLDKVGIERGWRVADVGCGPIGILNLLSERVGPEGAALGIEREARFADMARVETARRGLSNVKIVHADALDADLCAPILDFVHERLLLINVPEANQRALVDQMLALLRPGGIGWGWVRSGMVSRSTWAQLGQTDRYTACSPTGSKPSADTARPLLPDADDLTFPNAVDSIDFVAISARHVREMPPPLWLRLFDNFVPAGLATLS